MPKLILIVEDDSDIRDSFEEILRDLNHYEVKSAGNGQEALDWLRSTTRFPDLILLDVLMPVMDGFGFRKEQLNDPKINHIPIVVLSASHRITDLAEKMDARAYLKKPIDIEELVKTIGLNC